MDREKIIEDIEDGVLMARATSTRLVHLYVDKAEEIVELLKEQDAVEPIRICTNYEQHWNCGNCNAVISLQDKFCRECGAPIAEGSVK